MKRIGLWLLLWTCLSTSITAQTLKDIVNPETPITWLGLDFTLVKVVADQDDWVNLKPQDMFRRWNELMISEQQKYNVAEALNREQVKFALDVAMDHNAALPADNIFVQQSLPEYQVKKEDVAAVIKSYDFKDNTGIGFMLVAQSLDRPAEKGVWRVVFINMETKEIIHSMQMAAASSGFGLRNYWASTVYGLIKRIRSSEFKKWKKSVKST